MQVLALVMKYLKFYLPLVASGGNKNTSLPLQDSIFPGLDLSGTGRLE